MLNYVIIERIITLTLLFIQRKLQYSSRICAWLSVNISVRESEAMSTRVTLPTHMTHNVRTLLRHCRVIRTAERASRSVLERDYFAFFCVCVRTLRSDNVRCSFNIYCANDLFRCSVENIHQNQMFENVFCYILQLSKLILQCFRHNS